MTLEEVLNGLWELSITSGMNQRFHQHLADNALWWDFWWKLAVALATSAGAVLSVVGYFNGKAKFIAATSAIVSILGMVFGVWLSIAPSDATARQHLDLFRRWSDLRQDVDTVMVRSRTNEDEAIAAPPFLVDRYIDMLAKKNHLNSLEPSPDRALLERFQDEEESWREEYQPKAKDVTGPPIAQR